MRYAFLVSDSRSGSTLLARELTAHLHGVVVTPELNFARIFRIRGFPSWRGSNRVLRKAAVQPNLAPDLSAKLVAATVEPCGVVARMRRTEMEILLDEGRKSADCPGGIDWGVVKGGVHALYCRQIHDAFGGEARFIYLIRDPRAVVSSKMRTMRPYHSHEVMAWGGPLIAALRWYSYDRRMMRARTAGVPVLIVKYRDLVCDPGRVVRDVGEFLGLAESPAAERSDYRIPEAERAIHRMVASEPVNSHRLDAWRGELERSDRRVVEAICLDAMRRHGYQPVERRAPLLRIVDVTRVIPSTIMKVAVHVFNALARMARR